MLTLRSNEIEGYLTGKGLNIRRRGRKAELEKCPFCDGGEHRDRWTCVVYLDESGGNFKCMRGSCGSTGSFWQLAEHLGDDPKDYYEREPGLKARPRQSNHPLRKEIKFSTPDVEPKKLTETALKYLHARGFGDDILDDVAIWCDEKGLINFGYYHESELCFVKIRHPRKPAEKEQKAWAVAGGLRTLWGLEQCDPATPSIVITFGEYDRMAVKQAGIQNVVSVPSGDEDLEWISICFDELAKYSEIILWIDNDASGHKVLPKITERLGKEKIRVVRTEFKDANELLAKRRRDVGSEDADREIIDAVYGSEWVYSGDLIDFADIEPRERDFTGYLSGIRSLDQVLGGFLFGSLTVHTGESKHGKSLSVNQITAWALQQGAKACVWSGEDELDDYHWKMSVHLAGYHGTTIVESQRTGTIYAKVKPEYKQRIKDFTRGNLFVLSRKHGVDEDMLFENFELAFKRHGCDVFVIDNLMKLVAAKDTSNVNFRQAQIINRASDFAKDFGVHVHVVTHTNKTQQDNLPPSKKNVSGAKEITNLADNVLAWWRVPDAVKGENGDADSLCVVLANRVFGVEESIQLFYDSALKRFALERNGMDWLYSL